MKEFAPVIIPTLNRFKHFKNCVESLASCTHARNTDLIVTLDFPFNDSHYDGYKIIEKYTTEIKGFNTVKVIKRKNNYGLLKNYVESIHEAFLDYDEIIFTEDDNYFSPNFLDYINKGLKLFKDSKEISAICGYNYPIHMPPKYNPNFFYYKGFSAWGYGTWKNKYKNLVYSVNELKDFVKNRNNILELNKISGRHYYNILESIVKKTNKYADFAFFLNNVRYNQYCVFPSISKVRNYGFDGSGVNCGYENNYSFLKQNIDVEEFFNFTNLNTVPIENPDLLNILKQYFSLNKKGMAKGLLYYLIYKIYTKFKD